MPLPISSPTPPAPAPRRVFGYAIISLFSVLITLIAMTGLFNLAHSPGDSRALRLPEQFSLSAEDTSVWSRKFFWVNDSKDLVWAEVGIYYDDGKETGDVLTGLRYESINGELLMFAKVSATSAGHNFEVTDWEKKVVASIRLEDSSNGTVRIADASGIVLAEGTWDMKAGSLRLVSPKPEGLPLATVSYKPDVHQWSVNVEHCSKVPSPVYALLAAYQMMLPTNARDSK